MIVSEINSCTSSSTFTQNKPINYVDVTLMFNLLKISYFLCRHFGNFFAAFFKTWLNLKIKKVFQRNLTKSWSKMKYFMQIIVLGGRESLLPSKTDEC